MLKRLQAAVLKFGSWNRIVVRDGPMTLGAQRKPGSFATMHVNPMQLKEGM